MKTNHYDLEDRLVAFAHAIILLARKMPASPEGLYLKDQILRSGMAPALLYGEAQAAESPADFIRYSLARYFYPTLKGAGPCSIFNN